MQVCQAGSPELLQVGPLSANGRPLRLLLLHLSSRAYKTWCIITCGLGTHTTYPQLLCLLRHSSVLHGSSVGILLWPPNCSTDGGEVFCMHGEFTLAPAPAKLQRVSSGIDATHTQAVGLLLQAEVGGHCWSLQHAEIACRNASTNLCCGCVSKAVDRESWVPWKCPTTLLAILCVERCVFARAACASNNSSHLCLQVGRVSSAIATQVGLCASSC